MEIEELKYPVGKHKAPKEFSQEQIEEWIATMEELPEKLEDMVENLSYEALDWVYRPGGWSVKQLVHHLADSHMNSLIRFKLAMTEDTPTIRPYMEDRWAKTPDADNPEIGASLEILEGVHKRMVMLFKGMSEQDWQRTLYHPEYKKELTLYWMLSLYAWHSKHHLAHIEQAIAREGEFEQAEKQ